MRDHTDYKTPITIRASLNCHVRKRFPYATRTTAFSGRCYHVGVFYNKQASPDMFEALLDFRVDIHDDVFARAMAAANKILSRYHMSPPGFPTSYYLSSRDNARYDRLRAIMLRRMRRYTTARNNSSRLYSHAFPRVA
uniref:Uncharacterized protein n=1 Tax=Podoviridae sp. ctnCN2 TaxID=2825274 RepID=A0A8S5PKY1_9CAUD|nr:MAG TPA: hypothetical protein [Podoviridae sp. ctnCN2]